jgi:hypothetical protein
MDRATQFFGLLQAGHGIAKIARQLIIGANTHPAPEADRGNIF